LALTATIYQVDLSRGTVETKTVPEDIYRKYPGGSALAAYFLLNTRTLHMGAGGVNRISSTDLYWSGHKREHLTN